MNCSGWRTRNYTANTGCHADAAGDGVDCDGSDSDLQKDEEVDEMR